MVTVNPNQPRHPFVHITKGAQKHLANLEIDSERLNSFLRDDMGYESSITPRYVLYGRLKRSGLKGLHIPFTPYIFIQTPSSMWHDTDNDQGLARTSVHETTHFIDSWDHPVRTAGETALRYAATLASIKYLGLDSAETTGTVLLPYQLLAFYLLRFSVYYNHLDPSERRARKNEYDPILLTASQEAMSISEDYQTIYDQAQNPVPYDWVMDGE